MKDRQFKVYWIEYHDPANWEGVKQLRKSLKIARALPTHKISVITRPDPNENDGWHECEIEVKFTAKDLTEAKRVVSDENYYDESSGVFSCYEKIKGKWERAFIEEDLDDNI
jgi:hypothetical protein